MTEKQHEKMLQRVRALLAKANSTEFEEERKTFLAKADELMEKYAIDKALAMQAEDPNVRLVVRRDMDFSWWTDLRGIDRDAAGEIYWLWDSCVKHCRCVTVGAANAVWTREEKTVAVYGTESDLDYLDLLFTDLFMQMSKKLKPTFDPNLEIGASVRLAKEAGMTWDQILDWTGLRYDPLGKRLLPAYRKYCEAHNLPQVKINPKTYQWSFTSGFCTTIRTRFRAIREQREGGRDSTGSMALALRDIADQARDAMYDDFPDLKPHDADCDCADCKRKRKPVKYRSRSYSYLGDAQGRRAGEDARIVSNDPKLRQRKKLES